MINKKWHLIWPTWLPTVATIKSKLKSFFNITVIVASMIIGFVLSQLYSEYENSKKNKVPQTKFLETTSTAINERGELLIINRLKGTYSTYDKEVGMTIFNLYAAKFYTDANAAPPKN